MRARRESRPADTGARDRARRESGPAETGGAVAGLAAAGGAGAPPAATAHCRVLLSAALRHGRTELAAKRAGADAPVEIAIAQHGGRLLAAIPAPAGLRADPEQAPERTWLLVAAAVGALVELAEPGPPRAAADLNVTAGEHEGALVVALPAPELDPDTLDELAGLAFEDHASRIPRLRAQACTVTGAVLAGVELRAPIGATHPLRVAEAVACLGGRPADPESVEAHEEAVLALIAPAGGRAAARPHEDPDPARRAARRILQRLDGMGKWGGFHTDFAHLARGFAGNDRKLAQAVGEALVTAGLLAEKPSVGQRHVFLNPRRAADIHKLIETGEAPPGLKLPQP